LSAEAGPGCGAGVEQQISVGGVTREDIIMAENVLDLCNTIRKTGYALYGYLRAGHLEKVYERGLAHRLAKQGLKVQTQYPQKVYDEDGTVLGDYAADLFVEDCLIVEVKACSAIAPEHIAQLLGYLRASRIEHGLLANFGGPRFQIRKFILTACGLAEEPHL
jgi:GxxExxY protein